MNIELVPDVTDIDLAFPTVKADKKLLAMAREQGFCNGDTKYNKMFSNLFFTGGKIESKAKISDESKVKIIRYFKALAGSFAPKHEEKEAVCALLLSWLNE